LFQDFKRAGISRLLKEKGRELSEQFWQTKGQFASYKEKLETFFKGQGAPWEGKGHKGAPWCQKGTASF
jgi:hypothetical protein